MGKFDFQVDPGFLRQLGKLADVEKVAPLMIDESMPILERNLKSELSKYKRTGEMIASVRKTKAGKNKNGFYATVRPTGKDSKGVRNMEKLVYLEYGTSDQPATPLIDKVLKDSESAVLQKMQEVFEREVKV